MRHECSGCSDKCSVGKHVPETVITKAGFDKQGKKETKCTVCGRIIESTPIYGVLVTALGGRVLDYTGETFKIPTAILYDTKSKRIDSSYIKVSGPATIKDVGKYTYTVELCGDYYEGTTEVIRKIRPPKTTLGSLNVKGTSITVNWKRKPAEAVDGYEIMYDTVEDFTKNPKKVKINSATTAKKAIANLKERKKYYFKIRTFKKVDGGKMYSKWSDVKMVKTQSKAKNK